MGSLRREGSPSICTQPCRAAQKNSMSISHLIPVSCLNWCVHTCPSVNSAKEAINNFIKVADKLNKKMYRMEHGAGLIQVKSVSHYDGLTIPGSRCLCILGSVERALRHAAAFVLPLQP